MILIRVDHISGGQPEIGLRVTSPGSEESLLSTDTLDMAALDAQVFSSRRVLVVFYVPSSPILNLECGASHFTA